MSTSAINWFRGFVPFLPPRGRASSDTTLARPIQLPAQMLMSLNRFLIVCHRTSQHGKRIISYRSGTGHAYCIGRSSAECQMYRTLSHDPTLTTQLSERVSRDFDGTLAVPCAKSQNLSRSRNAARHHCRHLLLPAVHAAREKKRTTGLNWRPHDLAAMVRSSCIKIGMH
jgi:hypothetical protein